MAIFIGIVIALFIFSALLGKGNPADSEKKKEEKSFFFDGGDDFTAEDELFAEIMDEDEKGDR